MCFKFIDGKWDFLLCIEKINVLALGLAWLKGKLTGALEIEGAGRENLREKKFLSSCRKGQNV
jgi:hypothetical protein